MAKSDRSVSNWLFLGVVLVFFQVVIGGVTRLTDSGLSITEWSVIQGTLPPFNEVEWNDAFEKYKVHASKQYLSLHADMDLSSFKVIFFWEYFHRLWARMMGFAFLLPFLFFLSKKRLKKRIIGRLGVVILLAICAATFGWIMVASGLNDDSRTWVSAYKLIIHLGIATTLIAYLYKTYLISLNDEAEKSFKFFPAINSSITNKDILGSIKFGRVVLFILFIQILLGGLMAGMRAGLLHPHFPVFVNFDRFLLALDAMNQSLETEIVNYEPSSSIKAIVQIFHRSMAYLLLIISVVYGFYLNKRNLLNRYSKTFLVVLSIQFLLGVLTIVNCFGSVPVFYGAAHQAVALILLMSLLRFDHYLLQTNK
ncbi:MAG: COX15/CtaA family protein [Saprospiraceae bacterium]|nr:COX15/CtaA family protein [Saprospiraceae bacterium]